jgi:hypothetical protein
VSDTTGNSSLPQATKIDTISNVLYCEKAGTNGSVQMLASRQGNSQECSTKESWHEKLYVQN